MRAPSEFDDLKASVEGKMMKLLNALKSTTQFDMDALRQLSSDIGKSTSLFESLKKHKHVENLKVNVLSIFSKK